MNTKKQKFSQQSFTPTSSSTMSAHAALPDTLSTRSRRITHWNRLPVTECKTSETRAMACNRTARYFWKITSAWPTGDPVTVHGDHFLAITCNNNAWDRIMGQIMKSSFGNDFVLSTACASETLTMQRTTDSWLADSVMVKMEVASVMTTVSQ